MLSRGHDPAAIEEIPAEKIFYLQLADAPALTMDVLSWSRHHRLFPGEGAFDLAAFVSHVLATGYDGPLSLEVFNDTFRQTDPDRTAVHALRSLLWLQDKGRKPGTRRAGGAICVALTAAKPPTGFDFVEVKAEDTSAVEVLLAQLGFTSAGGTAPSRCRCGLRATHVWSSTNSRPATRSARRRRRAAGPRRRRDLPACRRADGPRGPPPDLCHRAALGAVAAPDGTEIFWVTGRRR